MEGIVRQARLSNPCVDIVMTFFVDENILPILRSGKTSPIIEAHMAVARHYGISSVNLAAEVASRISAGKLTWRKYGGVHPASFGNRICANMIGELLAQSWAVPPSSSLKPHPLPADCLDPLSYYRGRFLERSSITESEGWTWKVPDWRRIPGSKRPRFARVPMFCANRPGSKFKLSFTGTAIGTYIVAGPDAGFIDVVIDRGAPQRVRLAGAHSHYLNYPWTRIFSDTLKDGEHTLEVSFPDIPQNRGKVARLMYFVAN